MSYAPRLSHAVLNAIMGIGFVWLLAVESPWSIAYLVGAVTFLAMAALVFLMLFQEQRREFYSTMASFAEALARLNPDQWQALGIRFPHLRIRWHGKPIQFFEDTGATMDDLERFMRESNARQISPERNWTDGPQRRAWAEIHAWLIEHGMIFEASAAGNHSWLWRGNSYSILWQRYIHDLDLKLVNLGELEASEP
jgi:hypothetical protein